MSSKKRLLAVAMAALLCASGVASAGVVASTAAVANDSLDVSVDQAGNDGATVTVSQNESAVENASLTVTSTNNSSYAGAGEHETDENGTVELPAPEETVTVEVTAAKGNLTGETTAELTAKDDEEDGPKGTFGQMVSSFVQDMLNGGNDDGAIGQMISDYVTSNNPGSEKKADHAGKTDDVGPQNVTDGNESQGPPENAGPNDDGDEDEKDNGGNGKNNGHGKDRSNGKDY